MAHKSSRRCRACVDDFNPLKKIPSHGQGFNGTSNNLKMFSSFFIRILHLSARPQQHECAASVLRAPIGYRGGRYLRCHIRCHAPSFLIGPSFIRVSFALACVLSWHARPSIHIHVFGASFASVLIDVCYLFDLRLRVDVTFSLRTDKTVCVSSSPAHTPRALQPRACPTSTHGPASLRPRAPPLSCVTRLQVDSRLRPHPPVSVSSTRRMHVGALRCAATPPPDSLISRTRSSPRPRLPIPHAPGQ
ncbi:hypothetical protein B0H11DRAFT_2287577 [Mycena galericulata]|nr:hypothetical protein B0H11DRAFT_2287577 [Mycena galericulata]